ncbi:globin domain-containing protein [Pedobacter sp. UC225_61]|uniref:globin domain-containing protein n=1 Tax=Pedobacter sp. UC225_61 TaxID=3374623 RepID=UPI00379B111B
MKPENIELVQKSWFLITQMDKKVLGRLFYNRLFKIAPDVKPMFNKRSMPAQYEKLLDMLSYIIKHLDQLDTIAENIAGLAQRHVAYGVQPAHYQAVGTALLWSMRQGFGKYWEEEFTVAWNEIYSFIAAKMIAAGVE